jgi:membrane-anchored protein YejM (alkaline phosphatase superfamily)
MYTLAAANSVASNIAFWSHRPAPVGPPMDVLAVSGFLVSVLTLLFWMHRRQSTKVVLALAVSLTAMSIYGFLQGAWPLGIILCVWSAAAFRQWYEGKEVLPLSKPMTGRAAQSKVGTIDFESRINRMFGPN